jgi:LysR family hydrogen peroxide-inducible transcriptional activator
MNIQQIEYVLAVVDLKNFQLAAEKCFVTQSTLSTMIGKLENEIDLRIFNRKTKPVTITKEGKVIVEHMRKAKYEIDALKNVVSDLKGKLEGEIKIGIIPTIAPYLLPLVYKDFEKKIPHVAVKIREMTTSEIRNGLKNRTIDVGILALPLEDKELVETEIYNEPFLVYDCTGNISSFEASLKDLDYDKLCLLEEGHCLRTQVLKICEKSLMHSKTKNTFDFQSGSMDSLIKITKIRKGLTLIPQLAINSLVLSDGETIKPFTKSPPARTIGFATHKYFVKRKLKDQLISIIKKNVQDMLPQTRKNKIIKPL